MSLPNVDQILNDLTESMTAILSTDVKLLRGYSQTKAKTIARFTRLIAEGVAEGEISPAELEDELDELDFMIERFVRNMKALALTTIERLIKVVTGSLYGIVKGAATAAGVPLPALDLASE
ncbi:hypothetical protein ACTL6U_05535 [Rhodovibrionaceae bacterium A322]